MKIALYISEGVEQIVLTPETDTERALLGNLTAHDRDLSIKHGSFFDCQGGWIRHNDAADKSTMIVLRKKAVDQ